MRSCLTTATAMFVIDGGGPAFLGDFRQGAPSTQIDHASAAPSAGAAPNIYVVLLDGYPRGDTVRDRLHLDDDDFRSDLLGMDFSIAAGNRSNYPLTLLSLSSMSQMRLLNDVPDLARALRGDGSSSAFRNAINDGPALDTLRAHGYRVYATSPDYEGVALRQADVYLDPGTLNSFERALLARNGLAMVVQTLWPSFVGDQSRAKVEGGYRALEALSELPAGPRFAFVHIPIPHQPNLYGPNGEARDVPLQAYGTMDNMDVGSDAYVRDYQGQLRYVANRTIKAIRTVIACRPRSGRRGDVGPRFPARPDRIDR